MYRFATLTPKGGHLILRSGAGRKTSGDRRVSSAAAQHVAQSGCRGVQFGNRVSHSASPCAFSPVFCVAQTAFARPTSRGSSSLRRHPGRDPDQPFEGAGRVPPCGPAFLSIVGRLGPSPRAVPPHMIASRTDAMKNSDDISRTFFQMAILTLTGAPGQAPEVGAGCGNSARPDLVQRS